VRFIEMDFNCAEDFINNYFSILSIDVKNLKAEIEIFKSFQKRKGLECKEVLPLLDTEVVPNLYLYIGRMAQIALTIPILPFHSLVFFTY